MDFKDFFLTTPEKKLGKAYDYMESGKYDRARSLLESSLKKDPRNESILLAMIQCSVYEGNKAEASKAITRTLQAGGEELEPDILSVLKGIKGDGKNVDFCYVDLAEYHIKRRNLKDAYAVIGDMTESGVGEEIARTKKQCERLAGSPPTVKANMDHFYKLGLMLERAGEFTESIKLYKLTVKADPGEIDNVAGRFNAAISTDFKLAPRRIDLGELYIMAGKPEKGVDELARVLNSNPKTAPDVSMRLKELMERKGFNMQAAALQVNALEKQERIDDALDILREMADADRANMSFVVSRLTELRREHTDIPRIDLMLGKLYLETGDGKKAVRAFNQARQKGVTPDNLLEMLERAHELSPEDPKLNEMLGDIHAGRGHYSRAVKYYYRLLNQEGKMLGLLSRAANMLEKTYDNSDILLFAARISIKGKDETRAALLLRHLIKVDPPSAQTILTVLSENSGNNQVQLARSEAHLALGDVKSAVAAVEKILNENPDYFKRCAHLIVKIGKSHPDSFHLLEGLLDKQRKLPVVNFVRGEIACYAKDYEKAIGILKTVLLSMPDKIDTVRALLEECIEKDPGEESLRFGLVDVYFQQGMFDSVTPYLEKLLADSPGRAAQIIGKYKKLLEKKPDDSQLLRGLSKAYVLAGQPRNALQCAERALKATEEPAKTALVNMIMGDALVDMGEMSKAVSRYYTAYRNDESPAAEIVEKLEEVKNINPSIFDTYIVMGRVLAGLGKYEEGMSVYSDACGVKPGGSKTVLKDLNEYYSVYPPSRILAADISMAEANYPDALDYLQQIPRKDFDLNRKAVDRYKLILSKFPESPTTHLGLGRAYAALSMYGDAVRSYEKACELNPEMGDRIIKFAGDIIKEKPDIYHPHMTIAKIYLSRGDLKSAVQRIAAVPDEAIPDKAQIQSLLKEIAGKGGDKFDVLMEAGKQYTRFGCFSEALNIYGRVFNLPAPDYKVLLGAVNEYLDKTSDGGGYLLKSRILVKLADFDAALDCVEAAVDPGGGYYSPAVEVLETVLTKKPGLYRALKLHIRYLTLMDDREKLRKVFDGLDPSSRPEKEKTELLLMKGCYLEQAGQKEEAAEIFRVFYKSADDYDAALRSVHRFYMDLYRRRAEVVSEKLPVYREHIMEVLRRFPEADLINALNKDPVDEHLRKRLLALYHLSEGDYAAAAELAGDGGDSLLIYCWETMGNLADSARLLEESVKRTGSGKLKEKLNRNYLEIITKGLEARPEVLAGESRLELEPGGVRESPTGKSESVEAPPEEENINEDRGTL